MKKATHNLLHYLPLLGLLLAGFLGFQLFTYDRLFQVALIIALGISYVVWGMFHHILHKDLTVPVVFEYFAVAFLGVVVIFSIVFRS